MTGRPSRSGRRLAGADLEALGADHQQRGALRSRSCGRRSATSPRRPPGRRSVARPSVVPLHHHRDQVRAADEARHEGRRRLVVDLLGRAHLLEPALAHHRDAVGHRERLFLVVGHEHEGDADVPLDALELDLHLPPQLERRARRAARRAAARSGRSPARARARRAGAARRRAGSACARRSRRGGRRPASRARGARAGRDPADGCAARRRRCRRPRGGGTGRSSGRRC